MNVEDFHSFSNAGKEEGVCSSAILQALYGETMSSIMLKGGLSDISSLNICYILPD